MTVNLIVVLRFYTKFESVRFVQRISFSSSSSHSQLRLISFTILHTPAAVFSGLLVSWFIRGYRVLFMRRQRLLFVRAFIAATTVIVVVVVVVVINTQTHIRADTHTVKGEEVIRRWFIMTKSFWTYT